MGATLRASRTAGFAGAALIAAAAVWSGVPSTSTLPSAAQGTSDGDLVDRFLEVAAAVPRIETDDILIGEFDLQAELLGDLVGDHAALEAVHDDAQSLFVDGDDARSPLGDLVGEGARAILVIEDGYRRLADFELIVPFETRDDLDVAVGTDEPRNLRRQGLDLVRSGHERLEVVIAGLRDVDMTADQADLYEEVVTNAVHFAVNIEPGLRQLNQDPTSRRMLAVTRFDPDIAGTAAARWASYLCVPAEATDALSFQAVLSALQTSLGSNSVDCPAQPNPEVLTPAEIGVSVTGSGDE